MKMKSFARLAIPALLTAAIAAYTAPVLADDSVDAMNSNATVQNPTLADSGMQNQDNSTDTNNNMNGTNSNSSSSTNDEGSPDTASSTGDDDY